MSRHQREAHAILTPVVDLLSLLIVGFLTLGVMTGAAALPRGRSPSGPDRSTADGTDERRFAEAVATGESELARLARLIAEAESATRDLEELEAGLDDRAAEIGRLKAEREKGHARIAELEAQLARTEQPDVGFKTGWPIQDASRTAKDHYAVMLSKGHVIPVDVPWFAGVREDDGLSVWPVREGLALKEALANDSPIMKRVHTQEFRRGGRVDLFVAADSFATFRAVREALVRGGVDFGWEPIETTTLRFVSHGREIVSQGPPR